MTINSQLLIIFANVSFGYQLMSKIIGPLTTRHHYYASIKVKQLILF